MQSKYQKVREARRHVDGAIIGYPEDVKWVQEHLGDLYEHLSEFLMCILHERDNNEERTP